MFEQKGVALQRTNNHAGSTHSPPSFRTDKSPLTLTSSGSNHRSKSKGHRISTHKLFEKAHQTKEGETYLHRKGEMSS